MNWQAMFYFLGGAAFFTIMMRLGCGAHVMGHSGPLFNFLCINNRGDRP
jgi:hypothetical protein